MLLLLFLPILFVTRALRDNLCAAQNLVHFTSVLFFMLAVTSTGTRSTRYGEGSFKQYEPGFGNSINISSIYVIYYLVVKVTQF
jgi:hypothetical protein